MARHCSDQSIGRSVRRLTQNPRGRRPSIGASARAGETNARDSVIRIERSLLLSRTAIDSMLWVGSNRSSSSDGVSELDGIARGYRRRDRSGRSGEAVSWGRLSEVGERPRQPVDLVDDDHVDLAGQDIVQQLLKGRSLHRTSRKAAVVIALPDEPPSLMGLALDVGLRRLALVVEGVEVLLQTRVGGDAG